MHTSPKRGGVGLRSWRAAAPILFTHLISDMERDMYGDPMYELEPMRDATKFLEPIEVQKITVPIGDADSKYYQQPRKIKEETKEDKDKKKKEGEEKLKEKKRKDAEEQEKEKKKKNDDFIEANLKKRIKESADARAKEPQQAQAQTQAQQTQAKPSTSAPTSKPDASKPDASKPLPTTSATSKPSTTTPDPSKPDPTTPDPPGKTEPPKYKIGDMVTFDYQGDGDKNHLIFKGIGEILAIMNITDGPAKYSIRDNTGKSRYIPVKPEANEGLSYIDSSEKPQYKNGVTGIAPKPSEEESLFNKGKFGCVFKKGDKLIKYTPIIDETKEEEKINNLLKESIVKNPNLKNNICEFISIEHVKYDQISKCTELEKYKDKEFLKITMPNCGTDLMNILSDKTIILNDAQIITILIKLFDSIKELHKLGIVHGDIKANNILVENIDTPDTMNVKLIDFGMSKQFEVKDNVTLSAYNDDYLKLNNSISNRSKNGGEDSIFKLLSNIATDDKLKKLIGKLIYVFTSSNQNDKNVEIYKDFFSTKNPAYPPLLQADVFDLDNEIKIDSSYNLTFTSKNLNDYYAVIFNKMVGGGRQYFSKKYRKTRKLIRSKYVNKKYRKTRKIKRSKYMNKKYRKTRKNTYKKRNAKKTRKIRHLKKKRMIGGFLSIDECNDIRKMEFDFSNVENIQKIIALLKIELKKHEQYSATHSEILRYNEYLYNKGVIPLSSIALHLATEKRDEERKKLQDEKQTIKTKITNYINDKKNLMDLICDINDIDIGTEFGFGE